MGHTPTTPAVDDRPLRFLEKAEVPEAHRTILMRLVRHAQALARDAEAEDKLQSEFGKEHVALIHDCDQFLRIHKRGAASGRVEVLLDDGAKEALRAAGFDLGEPQGTVFRMFGWVSVDPTAGKEEALQEAVAASYRRARRA